MRRLGSHVMRAADANTVPAGGALAVDRERFSAEVTARLRAHPLIQIEAGIVERFPDARPLIVATGALTGGAPAAGNSARGGAGAPAYFHALSPPLCAGA